MTFQTFGFVISASILWLFITMIQPGRTTRNLLLLVFSYYFYATWNLLFLPVILGMTIYNYIMGYLVHAARSDAARRSWTLVAAGGSLGVLCYFKYNAFFYEHLDAALHSSGLLPASYSTGFLLPIGLSFYTFQSLSYVLDCYRKQTKPVSSFAEYALFVAFFPTLLSGPISRASKLLPQIQNLRLATGDECLEGVTLIVRGLIKKMIFADNIALLVVDPAFASSSDFSGPFLLFVTFAYSAQIYMDLSGYTDMARGIAKLFGFSLMENFNRPYAARTISEFWQRWHISMSGFFRDYLYFFIGGSKHGNVYLNLMITFVVIGIWHGAGWNFVFYGLIHGSFVCFDRWRRTRLGFDPASRSSGFRVLASIAITLTIVSLSRILFRADGLNAAISFAQSMLTWKAGSGEVSIAGTILVVTAYLLHYLPGNVWERTADCFRRLPSFIAAPVLVLITYTIIALSPGSSGFIYFDF